MQRSWMAVVLLVAGTGIGAQEQAAADSNPVERRMPGFCVRAAGPGRCRAYLISDVSAARALVSTSTNTGLGTESWDDVHRDYTARLSWALGAARNQSNGTSWGAAAIVNFEDEPFGGLELRHRRWIGRGNAMEYSLGYARAGIRPKFNCTIAGEGDPYNPPGTRVCRGTYPDDRVPGNGVSAGARLVIGPYLGIFARGEAVRAQGENHGALFLGANASSYGSLGASAVLLLVGMLAMAQMSIE